MNFGELKPGDVLYLIDYNQFKKDLTYIKGLVQTVIVNEPPKENYPLPAGSREYRIPLHALRQTPGEMRSRHSVLTY